MKFLSKILLLVLIVSCSCLSKTKLKKFKQQLLTVPENLDIIKAYPEAIMTELNQFLTLYQQPELKWSEPLKETAKLATEDILENANFGQHSQLEKWQAQVPNDIFTEMCFNVNVTNSNYYSKALSQKTSKVMYDTKLSVGTVMKTVSAPSAQMFAKNIIESLESEHLLLSLNQYTHCGIFIAPMDQTKYPNEYLAVMHLIKEASGASTTTPATTEPTVTYKSCLDAQGKGNNDPEITILLVSGEKKLVKCDQESQAGGWTQIFSINQDFTTDSTKPVDDLGLEYTELYIVTKDDHFSKFQPNNWLSHGWNFAMNTIKFNDKWYASTETPYTRVSFDNYADKVKYPIHEQTQEFQKADKCQFVGVNHLDYCYRNFIMKVPAGTRVTAISDVESITGAGNSDNEFHYDFEIYAR